MKKYKIVQHHLNDKYTLYELDNSFYILQKLWICFGFISLIPLLNSFFFHFYDLATLTVFLMLYFSAIGTLIVFTLAGYSCDFYTKKDIFETSEAIHQYIAENKLKQKKDEIYYLD